MSIPSNVSDLFLKKRLALRWNGQDVALDVPVDVFSSHQLDDGTNYLMQQMAGTTYRWPRALDVGCGYGPLAIWLAVLERSQQVDGIERDWVAAHYAQRNANRAAKGRVKIRPGLAFEGAEAGTYDLIVSNLPAKIGSVAQRYLLLGAQRYLKGEGQVWLVVVRPLLDEVERLLSTAPVELLHRSANARHAVLAYRFVDPPTETLPKDFESLTRTSSDVATTATEIEEGLNAGQNAGPYLRGQRPFQQDSTSYVVDAYHNVPEFDSYSYATQLLFNAMQEPLEEHPTRSLAILNPTQGHLGIWAGSCVSNLQTIVLLSRDALELRAARHNLMKCGFTGQVIESHGVDLPAVNVDLVVGHLREKEGTDIVLARIQQMLQSSFGRILLLAAKASFAGRLVKLMGKLPVRTGKLTKRRGYAVMSVRSR